MNDYSRKKSTFAVYNEFACMKRFLSVLIVSILLTGCKEDVEKSAGRFLDMASMSFENGDYNSAKHMIDSIRILYPKAFETRKKGIGLMQRIEEAECLRTIAFEDSLIAEYSSLFDKIRGKYSFEKDEKYQDMGLYFAPSQMLEKNLGRNYLRGQVDEIGRMTIVSNYSGSGYIHHRSVKVTDGNTFAQSPVSDDYYEFIDLGVYYEKCNLKSGEDGEVAAYIAQNRDKKLKVTLIGNKSTTVDMTVADLNAIGSLFDLSQLLMNIEEHKKLRAEAERKLMFVRHNMASADSLSVTE